MKTLVKMLNESLEIGQQATPKEWNEEDAVRKLMEDGNISGGTFYNLTGKIITAGRLMGLVEQIANESK